MDPAPIIPQPASHSFWFSSLPSSNYLWIGLTSIVISLIGWFGLIYLMVSPLVGGIFVAVLVVNFVLQIAAMYGVARLFKLELNSWQRGTFFVGVSWLAVTGIELILYLTGQLSHASLALFPIISMIFGLVILIGWFVFFKRLYELTWAKALGVGISQWLVMAIVGFAFFYGISASGLLLSDKVVQSVLDNQLTDPVIRQNVTDALNTKNTLPENQQNDAAVALARFPAGFRGPTANEEVLKVYNNQSQSYIYYAPSEPMEAIRTQYQDFFAKNGWDVQPPYSDTSGDKYFPKYFPSLFADKVINGKKQSIQIAFNKPHDIAVEESYRNKAYVDIAVFLDSAY